MLIIKLITILGLALIFYQDYKQREVYWFLFPLIGLSGSYLHYSSTMTPLFWWSVLFNLCFVLLLILVILLYARVKLKTNIFEAFGLGDLLMFICLVGMFSTISFVVIFIFSLILSTIIHLSISKEKETVPLAGYMSLFFICSLFGYWFGFIPAVYSY